MTTLLQRCQSLETKLKALTLATRHANDLKYIQQRTGEWGGRNAKLKRIQTQTNSLTLAEADLKAVVAKQATLRLSASKVLARLRESEDIKELTRDAAWARLLKASEGLAEELESAGRKAWHAYLDQQGALESPTTLRQRAPPTPQNEEALRAYQVSHALYSDIARLALPRTPEDLAQLAAHTVACRQAFARLTFDLPAEVRLFYEAIHAGTASLAHVTPSVLMWLAEHGYRERFRVRSVAQ